MLVGNRIDLDRRHDGREDIANGGAEQSQNNDDDDGYQNEDERVLDQTLSFFFRSE